MIKCKLNYIGSKFSLLPFIHNTIEDVVSIKGKSFCDLFAGTGIVSRYFSDKCSYVIANDLEYYSYVMLKAYLTCESIDISFLNDIDGIEYKIFNEYSENGESDRLYFNYNNGQKIDGIRKEIEKLDGCLKILALASLLEASDKVANTASVYGAYLKKIKKSASKPIFLENIDTVYNSQNQVYNEDALFLINKIKGDILYLDPPYNSRQYSGNYHILNTIAKYDDFIPVGKTGQRPDNTSSSFCSKKQALTSFEYLIKNAKFNYIFVSYNNEGIITLEDMERVMSKYGKYSIKTMDYRTYKADNGRSNKSCKTLEYIHILVKQ